VCGESLGEPVDGIGLPHGVGRVTEEEHVRRGVDQPPEGVVRDAVDVAVPGAAERDDAVPHDPSVAERIGVRQRVERLVTHPRHPVALDAVEHEVVHAGAQREGAVRPDPAELGVGADERAAPGHRMHGRVDRHRAHAGARDGEEPEAELVPGDPATVGPQHHLVTGLVHRVGVGRFLPRLAGDNRRPAVAFDHRAAEHRRRRLEEAVDPLELQSHKRLAPGVWRKQLGSGPR
jgi:hypothetical protein